MSRLKRRRPVHRKMRNGVGGEGAGGRGGTHRGRIVRVPYSLRGSLQSHWFRFKVDSEVLKVQQVVASGSLCCVKNGDDPEGARVTGARVAPQMGPQPHTTPPRPTQAHCSQTHTHALSFIVDTKTTCKGTHRPRRRGGETKLSLTGHQTPRPLAAPHHPQTTRARAGAARVQRRRPSTRGARDTGHPRAASSAAQRAFTCSQ